MHDKANSPFLNCAKVPSAAVTTRTTHSWPTHTSKFDTDKDTRTAVETPRA